MKRYLVDVSGLSPDEMRSIYEKIDSVAFMVNTKVERGHVVAYEVFWDSNDSFETSSAFPTGQPYQLLNP